MSRKKIKKSKPKRKPLSPLEREVLSLILQNKSVEDICTNTGLLLIEVVDILTSLVERLPKGFKDAYLSNNGKKS